MNWKRLLLIAAGVTLAGSLWGQNPVPRVQARTSPVASNVVEGNLYVVSNTSLPAVTFVMDWGDGSKTTNVVSWPLFSHDYANGSVVALSYTNQLTALQQSGTSVSKKEVAVVIPQSPVANFSITPLIGPPPLATVVSNLTVGVYTNAVWTFANASSTNTLTTNAATFAWTFGASTNDFSTNTVSLSVAGYGSSALTKTDYVAAVTLQPLSVQYDGTQNWSQVDNLLTWPDGAEDRSISFWFKDLGAGNGNNRGAINFGFTPASLDFVAIFLGEWDYTTWSIWHYYGDNNNFCSSPPNEWVHYAWTYKASEQTERFYTNGVQVLENSANSLSWVGVTNVAMGAAKGFREGYAACRMFEPCFYNRTLSAGEVVQLYQSITNSVPDGRMALWSVTGPPGMTITNVPDVSTNANHAVLHGDPAPVSSADTPLNPVP